MAELLTAEAEQMAVHQRSADFPQPCYFHFGAVQFPYG
jgi:hypothetical protein